MKLLIQIFSREVVGYDLDHRDCLALFRSTFSNYRNYDFNKDLNREAITNPTRHIVYLCYEQRRDNQKQTPGANFPKGTVNFW
jgi:hypothetical protein